MDTPFLFSSKFHSKMSLRNPGVQTEELYMYLSICEELCYVCVYVHIEIVLCLFMCYTILREFPGR